MENIEMLVNELESEILNGRKAAFSNSEIVVNRARVLELISRIRANYPAALKEASAMLKDRERIMGEAEAYANATMDAAEQRAKQLVEESDVLKQARQKADQVLKEAGDNYDNIDYKAREIAYNLLDGVSKTLSDAMTKVEANKRKLIEE